MGLSSLMIEKLLGSGEVLHLGACSFDDDPDSSLSRKPAKAARRSGTSANISSWQRRSKIGGAAAEPRTHPFVKRQPQRLGLDKSSTPASKRPGPALQNPSAFPGKSLTRWVSSWRPLRSGHPGTPGAVPIATICAIALTSDNSSRPLPSSWTSGSRVIRRRPPKRSPRRLAQIVPLLRHWR
jgi:hypothetical protein